MSAHATQQPIGAALQRRVHVRHEVLRSARSSSSASRGSISVASIDERRKRAAGTARIRCSSNAPSDDSDVHAIRADVNPGDDDLGMPVGERPRLRDEVVDRSAAVRAARERRRAKRAVLVAAVLNAQERARRGLALHHDAGPRCSAAPARPRSPADRRLQRRRRPIGRSRMRRDASRDSSSAAAQPITTLRSAGRSRAARRTTLRSSASASAVTAQLLNTAASASATEATISWPADATIARTASVS